MLSVSLLSTKLQSHLRHFVVNVPVLLLIYRYLFCSKRKAAARDDSGNTGRRYHTGITWEAHHVQIAVSASIDTKLINDTATAARRHQSRANLKTRMAVLLASGLGNIVLRRQGRSPQVERYLSFSSLGRSSVRKMLHRNHGRFLDRESLRSTRCVIASIEAPGWHAGGRTGR